MQYLVIVDGYNSWGTELYVAGLYTNKEDAEQLEREIEKEYNISSNIIELEENTKYKIEQGMWGAYHTNKYVGGYIE